MISHLRIQILCALGVFLLALCSCPGANDTAATPTPEPTAAPIAVSGIDLGRDAATIAIASTFQLTAAVSPADATDPAVTWASSDTAVVAVSSTGLLKAGKTGTATVTATSADGTVSDSCAVTVTTFFAGYYDIGDNAPCYWEGTTLHGLETDVTESTYAYSPVAWYDGMPYIAGAYYNADTERVAPCYWEGTTRHNLDGSVAVEGRAHGIAVYQGTVYTTGIYWTSGDCWAPCYWEGTTFHDLSDGSNNYAFANSIAVSDGGVYIAGQYTDSLSPRSVPCYWQDGNRHSLAGSLETDAFCNSIAISGSTVYVAGRYTDSVNNRTVPCYWEGDVRHDLIGTMGGEAWATSIAVAGNTVYTTGFRNYGGHTPCYWEGTTYHDLTGDLTDAAYAVTITVSGGIPYIGGYYFDASKGYDQPCYWEGAEFHDLSATVAAGAEIYAPCFPN